MDSKRIKIATRLTRVSMATNLSLSILKIGAGLVGHSSLIIADGVDSLSDTLTTLLAYMGVRVSSKKADRNHPYGHERFEAILGKVLALFLFVVALGILSQAWEEYNNPHANIPTLFPLIAAIVSILGKIFLSRYTIHYAKAINSSVYLADGRNYMNDVFASTGALLGIYLARAGYPIFQPIFTLVISFFLFKISFDLYLESVEDLSDKAAPDNVLDQIREFTVANDDVRRIDVLKSRRHGKRYYVDMEIALDGGLSLVEAHSICEKVHDTIEEGIPEIKHIMIHVNPYHDEGSN